MATQRICSIDGCGNPSKARGWCRSHHAKWRRHGLPEGTGSRTPKGEPLAFLLRSIEDANPIDCIIWPYVKIGLGYGRVHFRGKMHLANRVVCELAHGAASEGRHAAHSCGAHACINKYHLRWATKIENEADKVIHGKSNRGERSNTARLKREHVHEIRALCDSKSVPHQEIASRYRVSIHSVRCIASRTNWRWLPER